MRELEYAIIYERRYGGKLLKDRLLGVEWSNTTKIRDLVEMRGRLCKTADRVVRGCL